MSASWGIEPGDIVKEFADLKRDTIREASKSLY
jgi:hypothetical protein